MFLEGIPPKKPWKFGSKGVTRDPGAVKKPHRIHERLPTGIQISPSSRQVMDLDVREVAVEIGRRNVPRRPKGFFWSNKKRHCSRDCVFLVETFKFRSLGVRVLHKMNPKTSWLWFSRLVILFFWTGHENVTKNHPKKNIEKKNPPTLQESVATKTLFVRAAGVVSKPKILGSKRLQRHVGPLETGVDEVEGAGEGNRAYKWSKFDCPQICTIFFPKVVF